MVARQPGRRAWTKRSVEPQTITLRALPANRYQLQHLFRLVDDRCGFNFATLGPGHVCQHCGQYNVAGRLRCWSCGGAVERVPFLKPVQFPVSHVANYGYDAIISTVTPERPRTGTAFERFTDSGPLALLPMTGDRWSLVWTVTPDRAAELEAGNCEEDPDAVCVVHSGNPYRAAPTRRAALMPSRMASSIAEYFHSAQRPASRMSCSAR